MSNSLSQNRTLWSSFNEALLPPFAEVIWLKWLSNGSQIFWVALTNNWFKRHVQSFFKMLSLDCLLDVYGNFQSNVINTEVRHLM